jgi:hypothetical protein
MFASNEFHNVHDNFASTKVRKNGKAIVLNFVRISMSTHLLEQQLNELLGEMQSFYSRSQNYILLDQHWGKQNGEGGHCLLNSFPCSSKRDAL